MATSDWLLLILALCGIGRVWWERYQQRIEDAAERARREYGRFNVKKEA